MPRHRKSTQTKTELGPGTRCFAYLRDSHGAEQELSASQQQAQIEAYAAEHEWQIAAWYEDSRSGKQADNRPSFLRMIEDCSQKPKPVSAILCWALSRIGRNENDRSYFIGGLRRIGIDVVSVTETIAPEIRVVHEALLSFNDSQYLKRLSLDVKRAQQSMVEQGFSHGGFPPPGYLAEPVERSLHRDGKPRLAPRWVLDEAKAPLVLKAFQMRAQGHTIADIDAAVQLYQNAKSYHKLFANPAYKGVLCYGALQVPGAIPAIVPPDLWDACQEPRPLPPRALAGQYLLTGLLQCGQCGASMGGSTSHFRSGRYTYQYYKCSGAGLPRCTAKMMRCEKLDALVLDEVLNQALEPEFVLEAVRQAQAAIDADDANTEYERLQGEVTRLTQAVNALRPAVESGSVAALHWLGQREAELTQAQARLASYQRQLAIVQVRPEHVYAVVARLRTGITSDDRRERKRVLAQVIERITVTDGMPLIAYRSFVA